MKIRTIHFDKQGKGPLYVQVYEAIKAEILNGSMKYGDQLPSIRKASELLSISKTSIEAAYQRLLMEGYILAKAQKGYFVDVDEQSKSLRNMMLHQPRSIPTNEKHYDLRSSSIDGDAFDRSLWLHYIKEVIYHDEDLMSYGDPQGEYLLRDALQQYAYSMRGVLGTSSQYVVGASFQSLLYLICSLYEGKKCVGMEEDGFPQAEQVFQDCGFTIVYIPKDEEGMCLDVLQETEIGILYINSASCGTKHKALHSARRNAYLAYAKANKVLLLEDDHNGELRYQSKMRPAMQGFDRHQQVIYIRSFSKLLLPSLRMSFMVLTQAMSEQYQLKKQNYNPSASKIEQLALAHFLFDGQMEKQVRRLRKRYERKSQQFLTCLNTLFPNCELTLDESNLQVFVKFDKAIKEANLCEQAHQSGLEIPRMQQHRLALSFASIPEDAMLDILAQLKALL